MHRYLEKAMGYCLTHDYNPELSFHHCAIIVKGGSIVSIGYNDLKVNGFVEHYSQVCRNKRHYCMSTHAEMSAILKARRKIDLRGSKIFVARRSFLDKKDLYAMSRPCVICTHILSDFNITRAYYTIDNSTYGIMNINPDNVEESSDKIIHC